MIPQKSKEEWIKFGKELIAERERKIKVARTRKFDTLAALGLYDYEEALSRNNASIMEPVYLTPAQAYHDSYELEAALAYEMPTWCYTRIANPTNYFLEETMALLETYGSSIEASSLVTSSGMSAIRTATDPFLVNHPQWKRPNIVASARVYGGTFQQFNVRRFQEQGIEIRWVTNPYDLNQWAEKIDEETRFVFGESPSNPTVDIFDIEEVAKIAHQHGIPLIVDATCASPAILRPLVLGADIVVQSASKVISTSGTSIIGILTARKNINSRILSEEAREDFATWAKLWPYRDNGPAISPMSSFLTLNDLRTLRLRVQKMSDTALKVARFLEAHPRIERVHYPGLESYPAHELAKKTMILADSTQNAYGFMLAAEIKEDEKDSIKNSRIFYDALQMIWRATDLGRVKTIATLNAISTHQQQGEEGRKLASISPSTCRISCGMEDPEDIIADLEQALNRI